ncbi:hypothetical protein HY498_01895 [Candidatus Woesearchaeota archaeon]|nr:hypothetical protein [Candidatus Woesearchaeota archaeon]
MSLEEKSKWLFEGYPKKLSYQEKLLQRIKDTKGVILKIEQDNDQNFTPSRYDLGVLLTEAFRLHLKHHDLIHTEKPEQEYPISKETLGELNKYFLIINYIKDYVAKSETRLD